jgi:hypothetical protein
MIDAGWRRMGICHKRIQGLERIIERKNKYYLLTTKINITKIHHYLASSFLGEF